MAIPTDIPKLKRLKSAWDDIEVSISDLMKRFQIHTTDIQELVKDWGPRPNRMSMKPKMNKRPIPTMSEVFLFEAPVDWRKSFNAANKAARKAGHVGPSFEVPKGPGKKPVPTSIRGGKSAPDNDPLKTSSVAELFETDAGNYFLYKGMNGRYYGLFVSGDLRDTMDLGEHGTRQEAIDAILTHHDTQAAGI